ncbi:sulfate transporter family protein [Bartonella vinsonii]|uniref:CysZ-like protein n=1 Tax=Bartonella vinsonii subsp. berkhoffii str. Tweed TaxID=1094502 RepID=N6UZ78_BARVB|nr:sulfate transporter family protein [Bartonella vinsonii]ENN95383.1 CysZ-like protein [Bartonella vinsonii subsp. berkhoffii str. Tweed]
MIFTSAYRALQRLLTPEYRIMILKALGITFIVLIILWLCVHQLFVSYFWPWIAHFFPGLPSWAGWLGLGMLIIFNLGLALLMAFLIAPITAMIGSFFIDSAAEIIEKEDYPNDPIGQALPFGRSLILSLKFVLLSLLGNGIAFLLFFVPGINLIAFYVINGYLLGREYFVFAAYRFRTEYEAYAFLRVHYLTVFGAGLLIALFVSIPILNLAAPLFAAAFMTHLHKMLSQKTTVCITQK